jgi:hypothetical protein
MPKKFIIPSKILVHQTEPVAISQALRDIPANVNTISNEHSKGILLNRYMPVDAYDKVIVKIEGGYSVPIQAWSYAQIIANNRSLSDTHLRFAYDEDNPDNLILTYPEMASLPGLAFEDQTLITADNLVPGERYIIASTLINTEFCTRGAEYVGKFENDPSNRLLFVSGIIFFQVPDTATFTRVAYTHKTLLTGPKRTALLTAIRAWADKEWEGEPPESFTRFQDNRLIITDLFNEDSAVSKLATMLIYHREVNSAIARPRPTGYPLELKIVRNKQIEIKFNYEFSNLTQILPATKDLPQFKELGKDVRQWREFFQELYETTSGQESQAYWSVGISSMSSLIKQSALFINNIR